jgi:hypothetical protein
MSVGVYANEQVRRDIDAETFGIDLVSEGFYDRA